ncbi:hypothetical protein COLO4_19986 [Corchorus olitorius]|uniref:Uncharacterized protein n=1 Tax=Corchorus olitorius TaxID=93759 RepID=A0A1R3J2I0_9ROSI|nr:hypothetical protein COLO4_19986 [Corchorus olitorius]
MNPGFGLGFKPTVEDHQILADARKMRRVEGLGQYEQEEEAFSQKMVGLTINAVTEEATRPCSWIYPMAAGEELGDWEAFECVTATAESSM